MEKIAAGADAKGLIDLDQNPARNLAVVGEAKGKRIEDLTVAILHRPRHKGLIREIRQAGARIKLITDGDIAAAIATTKADSGIDLLLETGGAAQGVLASAALRCQGRDMQGDSGQELRMRSSESRPGDSRTSRKSIRLMSWPVAS